VGDVSSYGDDEGMRALLLPAKVESAC
jgi:hypothetical protein